MIDNEKQKKNKRRVLILILCAVLIALCLTSLLVWQGSKRPEMSKTQESSVLSQVIGAYKKGKDLFLRSEVGGVSVFIPGCAIDQKGKVILTPLGQYIGGQDSSDSMWVRPKAVDISFIDQNNQIIERMPVSCPIRVCFSLSQDEWKSYSTTPNDFEIQYLDFNFTPEKWISLLIIHNSETHELCADHDHMGLFALAVLNLPATGPSGPYAPITTPTQPGPYEPLNSQ